MRATQVSASLLGLASLGFVLFAFLEQAIDFRSLVLLAAGAVALFVAATAEWWMTSRAHWVLLAAAALYSVLVLAALVLQIDEERMMAVRAGLSGLLLAGLLLTLWCTYGGGAPKRRRNLHNYYD